nr:protease Lon-related BREX system protein BrxL [Flavonifractor sp. An4]
MQLDYEFCEEDKHNSPIQIRKVTPIQMPHIDLAEIKQGRKHFTKDEWITILLRSTGMEADKFTEREKWLLLARMLPLVENNFNLCELGPRSTGKSHLFKEISPNSILVSGGQTTVANLFYNMGTKTVGLVGLWDCVAFDEVAGITFKDKDGVQIMKDYMASGSFARGKEEKAASASMAFVGNINQSVDVLLKTSHLFEPFPDAMAYDTAFLDRMHCYVPGWEIPKYRPDFFTNDYGFITDYLAEFMREMRKEPWGDACDRYFRFGSNLNQRDTIAVRKMVSGFTKLLYPDGEFSRNDMEEILTYALEMRRRVKEQLKKIGGMEFYDVNFSYIDNETFEERFVSVPEQGGGKLIPEGMANPGTVYTISRAKSGMVGVYRLETQMLPGNGKFERTGLGSDREAKEATNTAFNYLKANGGGISRSISTTQKDYIINYQDLNGIGMTKSLALPTVIAIASAALNKPTLSSLAVLGEISISGAITKVDELANVLQVCLDSGAKKILLPITSAADLGTVPPDLMGAFSIIFYTSAQEAVFKALGVE